MSLARTRALEQAFDAVARTRMAGVPVLNPRLRVQGVDFEPLSEEPGMLSGVLVTPWFMNLVRLPLNSLSPQAAEAAGCLPVGVTGTRRLGPERFDFIGAQESGLGAFEAASLFSPMFEFADQDAAVQTARAVLRLLREPVEAAAAVSAPAPRGVVAAPPPPGSVPSRRGFLFGRGAGAGGAET